MAKEIVFDAFGPYACFTRPESKVERDTYDIPTPSALRGLVSAIYNKPEEFYWQITKIEIMNPIKYIKIRKNETKEKVNRKTLEPIIQVSAKGDKGITQRNTIYLKDVYYRIYAKIIPRKNFAGASAQLYEQFERRLTKGQCFSTPFFGTRECAAYFCKPNYDIEPIQENKNFGIMLYDIFDFTDDIVTSLDTSSKNPQNLIKRSYFRANMTNGVVLIPEYKSNLVIKEK